VLGEWGCSGVSILSWKSRSVEPHPEITQYGFGLYQDIMVPIAHDLPALRFKGACPPGVHILCVLGTIKLNQQTVFDTAKIHNIRRDGVLPPELYAIHPV